jgi:hypothetical protein
MVSRYLFINCGRLFELRCIGMVDVADAMGKPFPGIAPILFSSAGEAYLHGYF